LWGKSGENSVEEKREDVERLFNLNCFALALERWRNKSQQLQLCSMRFRFRYPESFEPLLHRRLCFSPVFPLVGKTPWHSQSLALLSLAVACGNHFHSFSPRKTAKHFRSSPLIIPVPFPLAMSLWQSLSIKFSFFWLRKMHFPASA